MQQVEAKRLRPRFVTLRERIEALMDVTNVAESGFKDIEVGAWFGIVAPAATSRDVIERINGDISRVLKPSEILDEFAVHFLDPPGGTPDQFADQFSAHLRSEMAKHAKVVKEAGIKVD